MNDVATLEKIMVQGTGFEPAKHYALGPKPSPFDRSGTPAPTRANNYPPRRQRMSASAPHRDITGSVRPPNWQKWHE